MKANRRFIEGIFLGAVCGAGLAALVLQPPAVRGNLEINYLISDIVLAVSGHEFYNHMIPFVMALGILLGAAIGGFRGWMLSRQRKWFAVLSAFITGTLAGGAVVWFLAAQIGNFVGTILEQGAANQAVSVSLQYAKALEGGTTNDLIRFQHFNRSMLLGYVGEVEQWKRHGVKLDSTTLNNYQDVRQYLFPFTFAEKREADFFWKQMLPLAQEFIRRNGLPDEDCGTNNIKHFRIEFFTDGRAGCMADLKLKTGDRFSFISDGTHAEVWTFSDGKTKTYFDMTFAPKETMEAVATLELKNKLNDSTALELAKKFFRLQGHKEENFHPPQISQSQWIVQTERSEHLPYYEITWYRKDVTDADLKPETGEVYRQPSVEIEVSGIDSSLISYHKPFMPLGSDF